MPAHLEEDLPILGARGGEETRGLPVTRIGRLAKAASAQQQRRTGPRNSGRIGVNKIVPTSRSSTSRFAVSSGDDRYI